MFFVLLSNIVIIVILILIFIDLEKTLDNTFDLGDYLKRQEKREVVFAKNLAKYAKKKGQK